MDITERLTALEQQRAKAERDRAVAADRKETALARARQAVERLKGLGVTTVEAAEAEIAMLEATIEEDLRQAEEAITSATSPA